MIIRQAKKGLMQWKKAQKSHFTDSSGTSSREMVKWMKPLNGALKCNIDASVFQDKGYSSFGFLIKDANGVCVKAINGATRGVFDPSIAEAMAFKEALSWIKSSNISNIHVETDCQSLVMALRSPSHDLSYFGSIVLECVYVLETIDDASFGFIIRSSNNSAHCLARTVCSMTDFREWSQAPPFLTSVIASDLE